MDPTKKPGVDSGAPEKKSVSAEYKFIIFYDFQ